MAVETSFPDIHVTGPIHWFMRTPSHSNYGVAVASKIWYLGTCETKPQMQVTKHKLDVFNDLGGRKKPFQRIVQGETGVLALALNRFSVPAYDALCTAGGLDSTSAPNWGKGAESYLSTGSLIFGKSSVELWGLNTFFGTTNSSTNTLKKGRYFICADLEMHEKVKQGTEEDLLLLAFSIQNLWAGTSAGAQRLGFRSYYEGSDSSLWPTEVSLANVQ